MADERQLSLALDGDVDLPTYSKATRAMLRLLSDVEEHVTGESPRIDWKFADKADVVAVATPHGVDASTIDVVVDHIVGGFQSVIDAEGAEVKWPAAFGVKSKNAVKAILATLKTVSSISIDAGRGRPLEIRHVVMREEYGRLRPPDEFGSIDGVLDLISVRSRPLFSVKQHGSGRHIPCTIENEKLFEEAKDLLRGRVVVEGRIHYSREGAITSISEVGSIWRRPEPTRDVEDLVGALPDFTGGDSATDYVRGLRDEED